MHLKRVSAKLQPLCSASRCWRGSTSELYMVQPINLKSTLCVKWAPLLTPSENTPLISNAFISTPCINKILCVCFNNDIKQRSSVVQTISIKELSFEVKACNWCGDSDSSFIYQTRETHLKLKSREISVIYNFHFSLLHSNWGSTSAYMMSRGSFVWFDGWTVSVLSFCTVMLCAI